MFSSAQALRLHRVARRLDQRNELRRRRRAGELRRSIHRDDDSADSRSCRRREVCQNHPHGRLGRSDDRQDSTCHLNDDDDNSSRNGLTISFSTLSSLPRKLLPFLPRQESHSCSDSLAHSINVHTHALSLLFVHVSVFAGDDRDYLLNGS